METPQECPECKNEFILEDFCFIDDPGHEMCNGCWRSLSEPPTLGIGVHESIDSEDRVT